MILKNSSLCSLEMEILYHGRVSLRSDWHSNDAKNYYTRLYFVKSGKGWLQDADGTLSLTGDSIYLIPSAHDFGFGCEQLEKIFFHVLLPFEEKTDLLSEARRILTLHDSDALIDELCALYDQSSPVAFLRIKHLLYGVLVRFINEYDLPLSQKRPLSALTEATLAYVREHASLKLTAEEISRSLYVSASTLRNTFKAELGVPLGRHVDDMVFFTVQKMLTQGHPIERIAAELGFCDRHYLSRRFKEKFGKTISAYRREMMM